MSIEGMTNKVLIIGETGRTGLLRIQDHKQNYKNGELKSKLVCHALDTDHTPEFENIDVLASGIMVQIFTNDCFWRVGIQEANHSHLMKPNQF